MSRIGKLPIVIPQGVKVNVSNENLVVVEGKLGKLQQQINPDIKIEQENGQLVLSRPTDEKNHRSLHGLSRALLFNMIKGVSDGFEIKLELVGVGYRATATGQVLELAVGYSHTIQMLMPAEIKVEAQTEKRANPIITLRSLDKQLLGQIAAKLRTFRQPEPYKGKGIKFVGEVLRRKAGKAAGSAS